MPRSTCHVTTCDRPQAADGYCRAHYARLHYYGDVRAEAPVTAPPPGECAVEGCEELARTRGWCASHYHRWRRHGDVRADVPIRAPVSTTAVCTADGCDVEHYARGLCYGHYLRWRRTGRIEGPGAAPRRSHRACMVQGCEGEHYARGWCHPHQLRWYRSGSPLPTSAPTCLVQGCQDEASKVTMMCAPHRAVRAQGHVVGGDPRCGGVCAVCEADALRERICEGKRHLDAEELPFRLRREIVAMLWAGESVERVCVWAGITDRWLWWVAGWLPGFGEALVFAVEAGERARVS